MAERRVRRSANPRICGHSPDPESGLAVLARFDEVLIYGGRAHDTARAFDLLNRYVRTGGGLVVEASGSPLGASEPFPITGATRQAKDGQWSFRAASSQVTDGIDFAGFSPAR